MAAEEGKLPEYVAVIGSKEKPLTAPLKVGAHEDGYVTLSTMEKYSTKEEGKSVLDHDNCIFRLSDIVDSHSVVSLKVPFKVLSRTTRDKVILDQSDAEHASFEAFPRATQLEEENDSFDFFVIEEEHNGLRFRLKFSHEAHEEADEVHLKFHSLKVFVPARSIERVLEDEHSPTLMEMIHTRGFASEAYARISAELGGEYDDTPEDQLIGAPFKGARRKVGKKASSAKRSVKTKASNLKGRAKTKFSNAKGSVKRRFSAGRTRVKGFGSRTRGKINSLRGRKPKVSPGRSPPRIPPKPAYMRPGSQGRSPPRKPLPPVPKGGRRPGSMSPPRKPLPPIPKNKAKGIPKVVNNNNRSKPKAKPAPKTKGKPQPNKRQGGGRGRSPGRGQGGGGGGGGSQSGGGGGGGGGGGFNGNNDLAEDAALFGAGAVTGAAFGGPQMYPYPTPGYGGYPPAQQPPPMYGGPPAYPMGGGGGYPPPQDPGMYPPQGGYPPQQPQQPFDQDLSEPQQQQQFQQNYVTQPPQEGGGAPSQSYDRYAPAPNYVPEPEPSPSPPASPGPDQQQIGDEVIEDELTLDDIVSRRKRIVNHVAAVYTKRFGQPPSQQDLDTLRARLESKVFLTNKAILEVVVEWLIDVAGGRMA